MPYFSYEVMVILIASPAPFTSHTAHVVIHTHQQSVQEKLVEGKQLCKWNLSAYFPLARLINTRNLIHLSMSASITCKRSIIVGGTRVLCEDLITALLKLGSGLICCVQGWQVGLLA